MRPLNDNVVLKKEEEKKTTASGIILTTESKDLPNVARVVAVGEKCENTLHVGDRVVIKQYAGTNFKLDDEEYIILAEKDILIALD